MECISTFSKYRMYKGVSFIKPTPLMSIKLITYIVNRSVKLLRMYANLLFKS